MRFRALFFVVALILTSFVWRPLAFSQEASGGEVQPPPDGFGRLFVYRFGSKDSVIRPTFRIDGEPFGKVLPNAYFYIDLPVGTYEVAGARKTKLTAAVQVLQDQDAFVFVEVKLTSHNYLIKVHVRDPADGLRDVQRLGFAGATGARTKYDVISVVGDSEIANVMARHLASIERRLFVGSRDLDSVNTGVRMNKGGHVFQVTTVAEAIRIADIVFLGVPWSELEPIAGQTIQDLRGKIIVDLSFAWEQADDGYPKPTTSISSAELIQSSCPDAFVVRTLVQAVPSMVKTHSLAGITGSTLIASDYPDSKHRVSQLLTGIGLDVVDLGPLRMSRYIDEIHLTRFIPLLQRRSYGLKLFLHRDVVE